MKIKVYIQPNASRSEVIGMHGDALKIKIKAPPVDGEANKEIIRFLSECLDLAKKNISILHGDTGRNKLVEIDVDPQQESEIKTKLKIT